MNIKGVGCQEEVYKNKIPVMIFALAKINKIDYSQRKISDQEQDEIENKINFQYKYS